MVGTATDLWTYARAGCVRADRELEDVDFEFRFTSGGSSTEQRRIVDDLLAKGIDALAVTPLDATNQGPMIDAVAAQISSA